MELKSLFWNYVDINKTSVLLLPGQTLTHLNLHLVVLTFLNTNWHCSKPYRISYSAQRKTNIKIGKQNGFNNFLTFHDLLVIFQ